ncbi:hypothetical protein HOO68_04535 [Candidatus Gracilibacteria bacterium]|nr:hypothetical protein [Candidatus Gracilibacteria bacterium]
MKLIQKQIIIFSGFIVFILFGYFAIGNFNSSQLGEMKTDIRTINTLSQSGIETDTGKRLETIANSGTNWGMSPFGSGKPLIEEEKKPVFKKPNTEWKTRTLSGITYVFGEGNPVGIAMDRSQIEAMNTPCGNDVSLIEKGICDAELGFMYITPEIEKHLLAALSDPNWSKLATECENHFRAREGPDALTNAQNDPSYLIFDRVFSPGFLDIDRFISIEPTTGLKMLNNHLTISLAKFVMNGMYDGASRGEPQPNPYGDCVDRYGQDISKNLVATTILYTHPLMEVKGIIHEVFKEYTIPFSFY